MQSDRPESTDHLGRTDKDFAIEFGGYLADTVEDFLDACRHGSDTIQIDKFRALENAVYEFRKRASKV